MLWVATVDRDQVAATCTQVLAATFCTGLLAVSVLPMLSDTTRRSTPDWIERWKGLFVAVVASMSMPVVLAQLPLPAYQSDSDPLAPSTEVTCTFESTPAMVLVVLLGTDSARQM